MVLRVLPLAQVNQEVEEGCLEEAEAMDTVMEAADLVEESLMLTLACSISIPASSSSIRPETILSAESVQFWSREEILISCMTTTTPTGPPGVPGSWSCPPPSAMTPPGPPDSASSA